MPIQTAADSISNSQGTPFGFKNRVMNGGMLIDQRNVGAAVASSTSAYAYMTDKFAVASSTDGGVSSQQVSDAPTGFTKSLKVTVTTADSSLSAAQRTVINHGFEGLNMADLNWGTSTAKPVTLSFWVKSSVTGTFSVSFRTGNAGTSYTAPYTINQANTWEYETITIPGATIGTWVTDNTPWAYLIFSLGIGSDYNTGTLNSWVSVSNGQGSTSHTSLMSTLNATWQVTGVQLEVGTQATSFDWRPYSTELQLCKRYCHVFRGAADATFSNIGFATLFDSTGAQCNVPLPLPMRVQPTITYSAVGDLAIHMPGLVRVAATALAMATSQSGPQSAAINITVASNGNIVSHKIAHFEFNNSSTGWLALAAEL
jgi:hypothetical protein